MAFCTKCGNHLDDNAAFCPKCGEAVKPQTTQPAEEWSAPAAQPAEEQAPEVQALPSNGEDVSIMVKGILALALAEIGIPGIILGALAKKGVAAWLASGRPTNGKVKTGSILGKLGFIFGIIMTAFWAIYFLVVAIVAIAAALY